MARGSRSRGRKDSGDATTAVDDRATAVEQAAAAIVADDAPDAVSNATEAVSAANQAGIGTAQEPGSEFEGQNLELSEEQLAEMIGQVTQTEGLAGAPDVDSLENRKPGEDLLGIVEDTPPDAPFSNSDGGGVAETGGGGAPRRGESVAESTGGGGASGDTQTSSGSGGLGGDARDTRIFDLIDQPGETSGDPLSSFLDVADAKLGRDTGITAPSDQTNASPAHGLISAKAEPTVHTNEHGARITTYDDGTRGVDGKSGSSTTWTDGMREFLAPDGTTTTINPDGSTKTTDKNGNVVDETPALQQPGLDDEVAPIPEDIAKQLESDVARLRAARPQTGDGVTDPAESDTVEVRDPSATLPSHAEQGQELFGQPDTEAPSGGDANFNPGADSTGAGVITPGEDQTVATGRTRNDDPFADSGISPEPVTSSNDVSADTQSFVPSETSGTAIDETADGPDSIGEPA